MQVKTKVYFGISRPEYFDYLQSYPKHIQYITIYNPPFPVCLTGNQGRRLDLKTFGA